MKKIFISILLLSGIAVFLTNCASLTGFQDGRTVGQNNVELSASVNFSQSPDFNDWEEEIENDSTNIPNFFFPNFEFGGRYGITDKVDISLRLNTNLNLGVGAKVQVLGDQESTAALSLGAEVGTFGLLSGLWNVQVPVYFSLHPRENLAWYLSPRYIYQFSSFAGAENGLNYLGGNTGLLFGNRHKFGFDIGYYNVGADGNSLGLIQIGIGGRFALGGGGDKSTPKRK
jgi:hypothetical protein